MSGPIETERQALNLPAVRAIYQASQESPAHGVLAEGNRKMLGQALTVANVKLGAYDNQILGWLSGTWEPQVLAVIVGWIVRAQQAMAPAVAAGDITLTHDQVTTLVEALGDAIDFRSERLIACEDCTAAEKAGDPTAACDRHKPDYDQSARYTALFERLGGGRITT